jgi:hypothetical protein
MIKPAFVICDECKNEKPSEDPRITVLPPNWLEVKRYLSDERGDPEILHFCSLTCAWKFLQRYDGQGKDGGES